MNKRLKSIKTENKEQKKNMEENTREIHLKNKRKRRESIMVIVIEIFWKRKKNIIETNTKN